MMRLDEYAAARDLTLAQRTELWMMAECEGEIPFEFDPNSDDVLIDPGAVDAWLEAQGGFRYTAEIVPGDIFRMPMSEAKRYAEEHGAEISAEIRRKRMARAQSRRSSFDGG
jgi:hypothetical protein